MVAAIVPLILAILSYFASKKAGASDGEAALVAAGVGAGSYYLATETEWGQGVISDIERFLGSSDPSAPVGSSGPGLSLGTIGTIAGAGALGASASDIPSWVLWGGAGVLALALLN